MGISASKRVQNSLQKSGDFPEPTRLRRSQTLPALLRLRAPPRHPVRLRPPHLQVAPPDPSGSGSEDRSLPPPRSGGGEFAVELFADAVVSSAAMEVLKRVPVGVAGIAGFEVVVKPGNDIVVAALGAYALGLVTLIYLGLDG
ncbi:hypothetical protein SASPL_131424 [Salvia splendens]|uniref:Uncharacterized protein n=1 Tax=Salvia splendens TaxID=180675 RepID=A0A8X8X7T4_SALSN|nr:hypothetical protein SASPL_131415 [Salvia splendens]KAG6408407.1 hypothetical protein SASPL_131418 [Salvia splendens]KAG6408413.1 hypothetical protein SASPL_131424 [Salvia splendens]